MGNCIQNLSENVILVANSDTWIEGKAIQQLHKTAELNGMIRTAGMPDLHPGRGYPIGAAFLTQGKIYPALVGNDIGCGMGLWSTDIKVRKVNLDKFTKRLAHIDAPLDDSWNDYRSKRMSEKGLALTSFDSALGTIGGGNHFAELQQLDEVYDDECLGQLAIDKNHLVLLVHSGSRGLGQNILRQHVEAFGHAGLTSSTEAFHSYMLNHNAAVTFAELNRELIALRMLKSLSAKGNNLLDVNHNLVTRFESSSAVNSHENLTSESNVDLWVHRKGATPADQGLVMIPGSRGDYSYLVKPLVESEQSRTCLHSLAHGAGRKWIRSDCKARLSKRFKKSDLERTQFGSRVICKHSELIFEEAPEAYKSIDSVIAAMQDGGLIQSIARFKPVLTYKTSGGC